MDPTTTPRRAALEPARAALLLMDFQVHTVGLPADADALLGRTAAVRAAARAAGVLTVHVRVAFTPDRDPEVHRVLTEKVFPRQAEVVDAAELLDGWR